MSYSNYECLVTINGTGLSGASISTIVNQTEGRGIRYLGRTKGMGFPQSSYTIPSFSVTYPVAASGGDPLKYLTGASSFCSGSLETDDFGAIFTSGYLSSYKVNYSLDEGPMATLELGIFGSTSSGKCANPAAGATASHFPKRSYVSISSDYSGAVYSFNYQITTPRIPYFDFSQKSPIAVKMSEPPIISFNIEGYIENQFDLNPNKFVNTETLEEIDIVLTTSGNGVLVDYESGTFTVGNYNVSLSADDEGSFSIEARRYL